MCGRTRTGLRGNGVGERQAAEAAGATGSGADKGGLLDRGAVLELDETGGDQSLGAV